MDGGGVIVSCDGVEAEGVVLMLLALVLLIGDWALAV